MSNIVPSRTNVFEIKRGDTAPRIETVLIDGDGQPMDLTDALSVKFKMAMAEHPRTVVLDEVAAGFNATTAGEVWYQWVAGDTATAGEYNIEWVVTYAGSTRMTFPSKGYDRVVIDKDL